MKNLLSGFLLLCLMPYGCSDENSIESPYEKCKIESEKLADWYDYQWGENDNMVLVPRETLLRKAIVDKNDALHIVDLNRLNSTGSYGDIELTYIKRDKDRKTIYQLDVINTESNYFDIGLDAIVDENGKVHIAYFVGDHQELLSNRSHNHPIDPLQAKFQLVYLTDVKGKWIRQSIGFDSYFPQSFTGVDNGENGYLDSHGLNIQNCIPLKVLIYKPSLIVEGNTIHTIYGLKSIYSHDLSDSMNYNFRAWTRYAIVHNWKSVDNINGMWYQEELYAVEGYDGEVTVPDLSEARADSIGKINFVFCLQSVDPHVEADNLFYVTNKMGSWTVEKTAVKNCVSPELLIDSSDIIHIMYRYEFLNINSTHYSTIKNNEVSVPELVKVDNGYVIDLIQINGKITMIWSDYSSLEYFPDRFGRKLIVKDMGGWYDQTPFDYFSGANLTYVAKGEDVYVVFNDFQYEDIDDSGEESGLTYLAYTKFTLNTGFVSKETAGCNAYWAKLVDANIFTDIFNYDNVLSFPMCLGDEHCNDGYECTMDRCEIDYNSMQYNNVCFHEWQDNCFSDAFGQCLDENPIIPKICFNKLDCDDNNVCTDDNCEGSICVNKPKDICCQKDDQCDDGNICTKDTCQNNDCRHVKENSDCCINDDDCNEGPDVVAECIDNVCLITCFKKCKNRECGDDGCGGLCNICPNGTLCKNYQCVNA